MKISASRSLFQPPAAWKQFWLARQPRERQALRLMASMLGLAVSLQLGWVVFEERLRLQQRLPHLAQEAERVRALATRALVLKSQGAGRGESATASVAQMLSRTHELNLEMGLALRTEPKADGTVIVRGSGEAARWLQYVANVHATLHWQLIRCRLRGATGKAADNVGRVEVEAEFKAAEAGG